mgnify:FL=1
MRCRSSSCSCGQRRRRCAAGSYVRPAGYRATVSGLLATAKQNHIVWSTVYNLCTGKTCMAMGGDYDEVDTFRLRTRPRPLRAVSSSENTACPQTSATRFMSHRAWPERQSCAAATSRQADPEQSALPSNCSVRAVKHRGSAEKEEPAPDATIQSRFIFCSNMGRCLSHRRPQPVGRLRPVGHRHRRQQ